MKKINRMIVGFSLIACCCVVNANQDSIEQINASKEKSRKAWDGFSLKRVELQKSAKILAEQLKNVKNPSEAARYVDKAIRNNLFTEYELFKEAGYTPTHYSLLTAISCLNFDAIRSIRSVWPKTKTSDAIKYTDMFPALDPAAKKHLLSSLGQKKSIKYR